jgi:hypothetical protein
MTLSDALTAPDTRTDGTVGIDGSLNVSSDIAQQSYREYEQSQVQSFFRRRLARGRATA